MADISIHSLPAASALSGTEGFMVDQAAASKLGTVNQVRDFVRQTPANGLQYDALEKVLLTATDIVDVFVYDTRLDSDGGAWRLRACFTSWYNEALNTANRGARKEFPAVAALVVRSGTTNPLQIFDLTDLDSSGVPRLWATFGNGQQNAWRHNGSTYVVNAIFALNGRIYGAMTGTGGGLVIIDFPNDSAYSYTTVTSRYVGNLAQRSSGLGHVQIGTGSIVSQYCTHVHARVLPGASLDPAGLPIPTVLASTLSGVSVIHPTGLVASITRTGGFLSAAISPEGQLYLVGPSGGVVDRGPIPYGATIADTSWRTAALSITSTPALPGHPLRVLPGCIGTSVGLCFLSDNLGNAAESMVSYAAINYATGWLSGDTRGAFLCDNTTGNLVGANIVNLDGSSAAGFTNNGDGVISSAGGEIVFTYGTAGQNAIYVISGLTAGQAYFFQGKHRRGTAANNSRLRIRDSSTVLITDDNSTTSYRTLAGQVTPTGTTLTLELQFLGTPASGETIMLDDIRLDVATADRSYKGKGLIANGTLSRNAVGTGNDVVAFGGFSTSNYLSQPYNSDLDFGTGNLWASAWVTLPDTTNNRVVFQRGPVGGPRFEVLNVANSGLRFDISDGSNTTTTSTTNSSVTAGQWFKIDACLRDGQMELWINSVRVDAKSRGAVGSLSGLVGLLVGVRDNSGISSSAGSTAGIALLRFSATAPTPAQIRKMYQDEIALFDAGAKATLAGNSNSVVSLSVEESTGVLSAATGDGVSRFSGLRRIDYLDTASVPSLTNDSMKAVAAQAGVILLAGGAQAVVKRDQVNGVDAMNRYQYRRPPKFRAEGVTADATPTNLSQRLFVGEREQYTVMVRVVGRQYGAAGTENFRTVLHATVARDAGGNVTLLTTAASQKFAGWNGSAAVEITGESTSTMDAAIVVDTASQTLAVQVTGKAATRIVWAAELISETRISEETQYALAA